MMLLPILLLLFATCVSSLGFINAQSKRFPRYQNTGFLVEKWDDRLQFAPLYVTQVKPWYNNVLLQIDDPAASRQFLNQNVGAQALHAVVMDVGPNVNAKNLVKEGATVILSSSCDSLRAIRQSYVQGSDLGSTAVERGSFRGTVMCKETDIVAIVEVPTWGSSAVNNNVAVTSKSIASDSLPRSWVRT
eukprot:NODE_4951_length_738_cov_1293.422351_g4595_i0.p1 GENE.NODE_4951_length_738_cov_1293.422351_g4595_i0~~NODE_4951_length_738_cov_1293.422351_g4595_i0.p1  ORF type:complete len:189 (-),score=23.83 NODE_4951_length_738_cov_1293.422351_g4595_i0:112-678(-)